MFKKYCVFRSVALTISTLFIAHPTLAVCPNDFPEAPVITHHIEQENISTGKMSFEQISNAGERLFVAKFNICDGQGRPATTGGGEKRTPDQPAFIRTSSPEANSCSGCHAQPFVGGAGDFVANVFVLAQTLDPVTESVSSEFSNERNTLGMHGSGAIEMLAREMTRDLQRQAKRLPDGTHTLNTKGIEFKITKKNNEVVESEGIDTDLIIKPFHQAGVVVSLREFTVNAMNHHHGMQAEERFDLNIDKGLDPDFDEDEVERELTIGDITANTVWQASLAVPQQVVPKDQQSRKKIKKGEKLFSDIGCNHCHIPKLKLKNSYFSEPNPYNPPGTWNDTSMSFMWDMTKQGDKPRLRKNKDGSVTVRAYTDLKRHNLCDDENHANPIRFYCNEQLTQGRPSQHGRPGTEYFLTRKLWDVGNTAPYGHRGDITTITEAILYHAGEARKSRDMFDSLTTRKKTYIIDFLKSLQVVEHSKKVVSQHYKLAIE